MERAKVSSKIRGSGRPEKMKMSHHDIFLIMPPAPAEARKAVFLLLNSYHQSP